jgi:acetyltransferase
VTNLYANLCTFALNLGNLNLDARSLEPGKISLIAQSGTLSVSFLLLSLVRGFHPGKIVSSGNEAVVTLTEVLEYFVEDPDTKVIAMYIEAVRNGRKFIELCRSTTKPLVALKAGKFEAGKSAARSHTAAIAGSAEGLERGLQAGGHNPSRELRGTLRTLHGLGEPAEAPRQ